LGDWSGFTIVERLGAQIELIPHLFGATNRFPTGAARDLVHLAIFVGCHQAERAALDLLRIASSSSPGTYWVPISAILVVIESC
jgi:hypothetical protein